MRRRLVAIFILVCLFVSACGSSNTNDADSDTPSSEAATEESAGSDTTAGEEQSTTTETEQSAGEGTITDTEEFDVDEVEREVFPHAELNFGTSDIPCSIVPQEFVWRPVENQTLVDLNQAIDMVRTENPDDPLLRNSSGVFFNDVNPIAGLPRMGIDESDPARTFALLLALRDKGYDVAPNYVVAHAMGWSYAPVSPPRDFDGTIEVEAAGTGYRVAIVDTGWAYSASGPWQPSSSPVSIATTDKDPYLDTWVGGHGTFMAGMVSRQASEAQIDVFAVEGARIVDNRKWDGTEVPPLMATYTDVTGQINAVDVEKTIVHDEYTLSRSLIEQLTTTDIGEDDAATYEFRATLGQIDVAVLSFGTYGCVGDEGEEIEPLALREATDIIGGALQAQAQREEGRAGVIVAAAGNEAVSQRYYPAGFARDSTLGEWVISVGAGQYTTNENDEAVREYASFSNNGPWVEALAPGENVASVYPPIQHIAGLKTPDTELALWSGSSFAAPCFAGALVALAEGMDTSVRELEIGQVEALASNCASIGVSDEE